MGRFCLAAQLWGRRHDDLYATHSNGDFLGAICPKETDKTRPEKGVDSWISHQHSRFFDLGYQKLPKKETKNHKRQAFYDYLANDWAISTGEMPWASSGFAFADFLPASALEAVMFGRPNFCSNFVWVKIGENPSSFCWIFSWR